MAVSKALLWRGKRLSLAAIGVGAVGDADGGGAGVTLASGGCGEGRARVEENLVPQGRRCSAPTSAGTWFLA